MSVNATNNNLGWKAPEFNLLNVDNSTKSLVNIKGENGTVIVFICNHCPYVISIADRLSFEAKELRKQLINTVAIMSNDVKKYPEDSFDNMKIFSKKYDFQFPYLYDEYQDVAKKYSALCTPDFFGFDKSLKLMYRGRIDSGVIKNNDQTIKRELYKAMMKIMKEGKGPSNQFNSFGCSIKWKENE